MTTDPTITDWIIAAASVFAAVGTVGAVVVALWQVTRQSKRSLSVKCSAAVTGDPQFSRVIALSGTNDGPRPIKLDMAYLRADDGQQIFGRFTPFSDQLPTVLVDGESVTVFWSQDALREIAEKEGVKYLYVYFTDALGQVYDAPYPGVVTKRKGLRRRKVFELPEGRRPSRRNWLEGALYSKLPSVLCS